MLSADHAPPGDPEEGQPPLPPSAAAAAATTGAAAESVERTERSERSLERTLSTPAEIVEAQIVAQKMAQRVAKRAAAKWMKKIKDDTKTNNYADSVQFAEAEAFGSRAVGGHRPDDEIMYGTIESTDYLVPDTKEEERFQHSYTPAMRKHRALMIWWLYGCLALTTATVVVYVLMSCDIVLKLRVKATGNMLASGDLFGAWLVWTGSSLGLCLIAAALVLWQPAAASSGIPGLLAFLNGVNPLGGESPLTNKKTGFLTVEALVAKTVGMIMSIPSGLALGPEGPIIHISALVAHHTTRVVQDLSHKILPERFHFTVKPGEGRDFLATGAAVGICVAFRAPISGCLFVVEEASSFFTTQHLEYTFFATIVGYVVAMSLTTSEDGFTKFKQSTGYFCTLFDVLDMVLFFLVAVLGGTGGAFFNHIVEELSHFRAHHVNKFVWKRLLEVIVLVLVTGTVAVFLPQLYACQLPTRSLLMKDSIGCLSAEDARQISEGSVSHSALQELLDGGNCSAPKQEQISDVLGQYRVDPMHWEAANKDESYNENLWKDTVWIDNSPRERPIQLHYQHSYTCDSSEYNGMSMLWLNGGVKGVKVLMQRGFPHMLSWQILMLFFLVYFVLAACTSGIAVPAGLIVPMLLIGGSMGRAFGILGILQKKAFCAGLSELEADAMANPANLSGVSFTGFDAGHDSGDGSNWMFQSTYFWSTVYRWVGRECNLPDPGVYAVVGMASFLAGSGRITMMFVIVIVELTDDASLLAPVGVASIIAMVVGDHFNHGLYHALIPIQNLPFLNPEPADVMWLVSVSDVMTRNVKCLGKHVQKGEVAKLLEQSAKAELTHQAFPVVDCDQEGHRKLRGIISLTQLQRAFSEANKRTETKLIRTLSRLEAEKLSIIHLLDYADRSPITTMPHAKVARAFEVFRKLGMRHLCVADSDNFLVGILTRKDFMTYRLAENIKRHKAESLIRGWVCRWRKRREMRLQLEAIQAKAQTTGSVDGMYALHVRHVGEEGWDGTPDGRGTYEQPAKLESLFSQFGNVVKVSKVRHRIQDGRNTSWAIIMMETMDGMNAAIEGTIMTGETKLKVAPFSPKVALASTGAASSIVQTLELSQLLAAIGAGNASS
eukprot:COSAG06_NODE_100_length_24132_cov_93.237507_14_plen_1117_part_00